MLLIGTGWVGQKQNKKEHSAVRSPQFVIWEMMLNYLVVSCHCG